MMNLKPIHDESFPVLSSDQIDIYELYTILKRRGRLETERIESGLVVNQKLRDLADKLDMEQRIIDRRTYRREENDIF
jgi:hypothetical protein